MRPRLPPLNALKVFEAAARHMSFRRAAEELNVTHSAVSHQVKALEEQFGGPLFERASRRVSLTEAGEVYYPILRDAFDRIARGAELVRTVESPNVLTVQVYVSMALRWLIPRLHRFEARHPDINVRLSTSYLQWEFDRGNVDVGIVIAAEREPGLHYTRLFRSEVFPVCAPRFVDGPQALQDPADLLGVPLLHVYTVPNDWRRWLQAAGIETGAGGKGTSFDSFVLALEAAIAGQGVALSNMMFVRDDLETGRLVKPFDIGVPQEGEWFLACAEGSEDQAKIAVFRDWLVAELKADPDVGDTVDKLAKWRTVKISDFDFARDGWLQKASVRAQAAPGRKFGFFDRSLRLKNAWCGSVGKKFQAEFSRPSLSTVSGG